MTTSEARQNFSGVLSEVRKGNRALLNRHDKPFAAIVSVEDLRLIHRLEDREDISTTRAALSEDRVTLDELKAELGL